MSTNQKSLSPTASVTTAQVLVPPKHVAASSVPPMLQIFGGAALGAVVVLFIKPLLDWYLARRTQNRAYRYHMRDRIRDFRESVAVINSIEHLGRHEAFPVDAHITKLGIPEGAITDKAVDIKALSEDTASEALYLSNLLVNINREATSIIEAKKANKGDAFYKQLFELGDKLRNLADKWEDEHKGLPKKKLSTDPKPIMYDDGTKLYGVSYQPTWHKPAESPWFKKNPADAATETHLDNDG